MFCKLYDVEGELILINGSGWSAGIIPPHLMVVSNAPIPRLSPCYLCIAPVLVMGESNTFKNRIHPVTSRLCSDYHRNVESRHYKLATRQFKETRSKKTLIIRECKDVGVDRCTDASV
ncbi:hypothetical protein J6590_036666 [Homalodisca vitripennis]|nr:hypothetical protein J6590_036666 [Homalodisca vitripennis]